MDRRRRASLRLALATAWIALALGAIATAPATAQAQSGLQRTPDGKRVLVSKDVGGERWAITRNLAGATVTGNVFFPDGGPPQFLWCEEGDAAEGMVALSCWGADRCPVAPCAGDEWTFIASVVLPESFFAGEASTAHADLVATAVRPALTALGFAPLSPPLGERWLAGRPEQTASRAPSLPQQSLRLRARPASAVAADSPPATGVQSSPDRAQTLLSKDVAGQRWAIAVNHEDGTVTGNVFFPGGGPPQFVWCERRDQVAGEVRLACSGADACAASGCTAGDWTFISEVSLPATFFAPDEQIDLAAFVAAVVGRLGEDGGARALLLALDRGYSLAQIARAGLTGRLDASGTVFTSSGATAVPDGPPLGLFAAGAAARAVPSGTEFSLEEIIRVAKQNAVPPGALLLEVITILLSEGYDADTVVAALATGATVDTRPDEGPGYRLVERDAAGNRRVIPPERPQYDPWPPVFSYGTCGNGRVDGSEACELGVALDRGCRDVPGRNFTGGTLACTLGCQLDVSACTRPPTCGNGAIDADEDCDGDNVEGATCRDLGYAAGTLRCTKDCSFATYRCLRNDEPECGDGALDGDEECDGINFGGAVCRTEGDFDDGFLLCTKECRIDLSRCTRCGDGQVQGREQCDGANLGDTGTCEDHGFGPGTVHCSTTCNRDFSGCAPAASCGNGVREGNEACDGDDFGGATCESRGFTGGHLHCSAGCAIDTSGCTSEQCPGPDVECGADCMPAGGDCCNAAGNYCDPGKVCAGQGCCPVELPQPCPPSSCAPAGAVCCEGGRACAAGQVCVLGGTACCPDHLPKACAAAGICIPAGDPCP